MNPLRYPRRWLSLLAAIALPASLSATSLFDYLFPPPELQTITVTDMTREGRSAPQPSPGHPVYYAAISGGYHDFGAPKGGDRKIARAEVNKAMIKVLAKEGYLPVGPNQVPDIIVGWTWGTMYIEDFIGPRGLHFRAGAQRNLIFAGGQKLGITTERQQDFPELTEIAGITQQKLGNAAFIDTVDDDLYVAVVSAYDVHVKPNHKATLLWVTRISTPSKGFWLPDALPAMLVMAGPCIGHETDKPVWVNADEKFKPQVRIGDPRVVNYLETNRPVVVNIGKSQ